MIETERLLLRPFLETDAADVYEYLHKPAANCFACMKLDSLDEARAEIFGVGKPAPFSCQGELPMSLFRVYVDGSLFYHPQMNNL